ncbi:MAG: hypothetical protein PVJ63_06255 [Thioalkalispiraceae bacterium]|jgi:hypothetical protein
MAIPQFSYKKVMLPVLFLALAALVLGGGLDARGGEYTDAAFQRALVAFGIAKGLNGVISVAQGTEVALQPAGIGVNFTPGEILDPINDLIEQFSWIMLASTASIGVQKILLTISVWPWFSYGVVLLLLFAALCYWYTPLQQANWRPVLMKLTLVLVFLRFSVPLVAIGSELVYVQFLSSQYTEATQQLDQAAVRIGNINKLDEQKVTEQKQGSIWESAKQMYGQAAAAMDINARIEQYKQAASDATKYAINLIVVFVFQTILFPLLFLLVIYQLLKKIIKLDWIKG